MARIRAFARLSATLAIAAGLGGAVATPAGADVAPLQTYCGDSDARWFNLFTTDGGVRGGNTFGYVAVTRDVYNTYQVCVGWPGGPTAEVSDRDADGYGAVAYARYEQLTAHGWQTISWDPMKRADGNGVVEYYERTYRQVKNFHVLVCRTKVGDTQDSCSGPD